MTSGLRLQLPSNDDPTELADWIEAVLLLTDKRYASRAWLRTQLRGTIFVGDGIGSVDLGSSDLNVALDGVAAEIRRRRHEGSNSYPFTADDAGGVTFVGNSTHIVYAFLLLISISPLFRREARHAQVDRPFDLIVLAAIRNYFGGPLRCRALRFAAPASDGRPTQFADAIRWLAAQLGHQVGKGHLRSHLGDGGADVVAWLPFADNRQGFLISLTQCTVQIDWKNKGHDIDVGRWRGYIDLADDPITALAIPFAIPLGYERWDEVRRTTTLVFDRFRIVALANGISGELFKTVSTWSIEEAKKLGASEFAPLLSWAS